MGLYNLKQGDAMISDLGDGLAGVMPVARTIFYVDADHAEASDQNPGTDPDKPLATIARAYALCTTNVGDVIYVKGERRYRENELTIEKDGISIIGAGWGTEWNRTSSQTGDYVVKVQAKGVRIANIQISVNGSEDGIYVGDGGAANDNSSLCTIENCFIRGNWYSAAGSEGDKGITIDGSSMGPIVRNCYIWGWTTGIDISDGTNRTAYGVHIHNNYITGKTYAINWSSGYGYTSVIAHNVIWDWKSSVNMTAGINLAATVGGVLVAGNFFGCATPAADSGDLNYWVGNFAESAEAGSELLSVEVEAY
jgi:hypothetical protein